MGWFLVTLLVYCDYFAFKPQPLKRSRLVLLLVVTRWDTIWGAIWYLICYLKTVKFGKLVKLFHTDSDQSSESHPLLLYPSCILPHTGLRDANLQCELSIFRWTLFLLSGTESTFDSTTDQGIAPWDRTTTKQQEHSKLCHATRWRARARTIPVCCLTQYQKTQPI